MGSKEPSGNADLQRQVDELAGKVAENRTDIDALNRRADASEVRADRADDRADVSETRAEANNVRIGVLESRADVDRETLRILEAEGVVHRDQTAHLERALKSSRSIGAAVGIIMARSAVDEVVAFEMLSKACQDTNRKVTVLAEEIVLTGDVTGLRSR